MLRLGKLNFSLEFLRANQRYIVFSFVTRIIREFGGIFRSHLDSSSLFSAPGNIGGLHGYQGPLAPLVLRRKLWTRGREPTCYAAGTGKEQADVQEQGRLQRKPDLFPLDEDEGKTRREPNLKRIIVPGRFPRPSLGRRPPPSLSTPTCNEGPDAAGYIRARSASSSTEHHSQHWEEEVSASSTDRPYWSRSRKTRRRPEDEEEVSRSHLIGNRHYFLSQIRPERMSTVTMVSIVSVLSWLERDLGASIDYAKSRPKSSFRPRESSTFCLVKTEIRTPSSWLIVESIVREKLNELRFTEREKRKKQTSVSNLRN